MRVIGPVEQPHVYPWATALRVPTSQGDVWFKASLPELAHEADAIRILARRRPELVTELIAADRERGWILMRDAGTRLRDVLQCERNLGHWTAILPLYAELQLAAAADCGDLLAAGVPDRRLAVLPTRFDEVLADTDVLMIDRPGGLTAGEYDRLLDARAGVAEMCADLAAAGIAETIQHDDFHDGQIFVRDGRYRFLDWGDSCVSHPFFTLTVTLRTIAWRFELESDAAELDALRDAYLEPWTASRDRAELAEAADLARRLGQVCRALSWYEFVSNPIVREAEADSVPWSLRLFLDPEAWREAT